MRKYSDSSTPRSGSHQRSAGSSPRLVLTLDTGSPLNSIAVGQGSRVLATSAFPGGASSPSVLDELSGLLESIERTPRDLGRLVGLQGPGSFTGLRGGLAVLFGLHQALGIPATALPTFRALAELAPAAGARVVGAVDALRGEWYVQVFEGEDRAPVCEPQIVAPQELEAWAPCTVVAFRSDQIQRALRPGSAVRVREAEPLAPVLLSFIEKHRVGWDSGALTAPLYLRAPAAAKPARRAQDGL